MLRTFVFLLLFTSIPAFLPAKEPPPAPTSYRWVQDEVGLLSMEQQKYLLQKLKNYSDSTSNEIAIVIEKSLEGDDVFEYSVKLAESWGIGDRKKDNGVLIYIAYENNDRNKRKIWIQVGRGLEGAVTDAHARRIIDNVIAPKFREKKYGEGLNNAVDILIQLAEGEYYPEEREKSGNIPVWVIILIIIVLIVVFSSHDNNGRTFGGRKATGPIWMGGGFGGFGGGSSGGGFGGGFGGGSFGGGGAGGSW